MIGWCWGLVRQSRPPPTAPRLVGFYDTLDGIQADVDRVPALLDLAHEQSVFGGAWGVHWTDDGRIVVSDIQTGLYVLRFTP